MQVEDSVKWELAMKEKMNSLEKNQTWVLTKLPEEKKALQNKLVYHIKEKHDGKKRYKAKLVVKGFQRLGGIDYTKVLSSVVKMSTIRLVFREDLHLEQLDVKTVFLHGDLDDDIYMQQPEGFKAPGREELVCRL